MNKPDYLKDAQETNVVGQVTTKHYIPCPQCSDLESFSVGHLLDRSTSFGPWYCDKCGHSIIGWVEVVAKGETPKVSIKPGKDRKVSTRDVLRIAGTEIYMVVEGMNFVNTKGDLSNTDENKRYLYEEHTCPTNVTKNEHRFVTSWGKNLNDDPHGMFEFVASLLGENDEAADEVIQADLAARNAAKTR